MKPFTIILLHYISIVALLLAIAGNAVLFNFDKGGTWSIVVIAGCSLVVITSMLCIVTNKFVIKSKLFVVLALLVIPFPYVLVKFKAEKSTIQENI